MKTIRFDESLCAPAWFDTRQMLMDALGTVWKRMMGASPASTFVRLSVIK